MTPIASWLASFAMLLAACAPQQSRVAASDDDRSSTPAPARPITIEATGFSLQLPDGWLLDRVDLGVEARAPDCSLVVFVYGAFPIEDLARIRELHEISGELEPASWTESRRADRRVISASSHGGRIQTHLVADARAHLAVTVEATASIDDRIVHEILDSLEFRSVVRGRDVTPPAGCSETTRDAAQRTGGVCLERAVLGERARACADELLGMGWVDDDGMEPQIGKATGKRVECYERGQAPKSGRLACGAAEASR